jgi:hypothetical protein
LQRRPLKSGDIRNQTMAKTAFIVWRCEVNSRWITVWQLLATIALATSAIRGSVAFAAWRKSFRDRLLGIEYSGDVT